MKQKKLRLNLLTFLVVCIAVVCIQIFSVKEIYAQDGVILQVEINNQKLQKCEENTYRLILPTKIRVTNKTDKNLLLIRDAVHPVGNEMAKTESDLEAGILLYQLFTLPSFIQKNLLNIQSPTNGRTEIIPPNGYYEWSSDDDYFFGKTRDDRSNTNPGLSLEKLQSIDYLWIKKHVAFFPMNAMEDEGNKLKKNWETSGDLLLDTITTQPIKISVPKKIQKINGSCD